MKNSYVGNVGGLGQSDFSSSKFCKVCHTPKNWTEFPVSLSSDNDNDVCSDCQKKQVKAKENNIFSLIQKQKCSICGREKSNLEFPLGSKTCRACVDKFSAGRSIPEVQYNPPLKIGQPTVIDVYPNAVPQSLVNPAQTIVINIYPASSHQVPVIPAINTTEASNILKMRKCISCNKDKLELDFSSPNTPFCKKCSSLLKDLP